VCKKDEFNHGGKTLGVLFFAVLFPAFLWGLVFSVADKNIIPGLGDFSIYDIRYRYFSYVSLIVSLSFCLA
jgi:hypothetical protein